MRRARTRQLIFVLTAVFSMVGCRSVVIKKVEMERLSDVQMRVVLEVNRDVYWLSEKGWNPSLCLYIGEEQIHKKSTEEHYLVPFDPERLESDSRNCKFIGRTSTSGYLYEALFPLRYFRNAHGVERGYDLTIPGFYVLDFWVGGGIKPWPSLRSNHFKVHYTSDGSESKDTLREAPQK